MPLPETTTHAAAPATPIPAVAAVAALATSERHAFARAVAARAAELGLVYVAGDVVRPISIALPPTPTSTLELQRRGHIAHVILGALVDVAERVLSGGLGDALRATILSDLSPLERQIVSAGRYRPRLATARADMLVDSELHPWVVEMNATIPAMQGYSDIAARAFIDVARRRWPELPAPTPASSNADDLLDALVELYRQDGGSKARPRLGIVHRRGDSQREELRFLAERWQERGVDAGLVVVDDIDDGAVADIWYRHIFAHHLSVDGAFATRLRSPSLHHVYNPVAAPLEHKVLLAALSELVDDGDPDVDEEARDLTRRHVPWTRHLRETTTTLPLTGHRAARGSLVPWVKANRQAVVVKRGADYGGRSVSLGSDFDGDWGAFVDACVASGAWVVQRRVHLCPQTLTLATPDVAVDGDFFVDASAYTSSVGGPRGGGAVSRCSASPIVNIQRGGGVVALISDGEFTDPRFARVGELNTCSSAGADEFPEGAPGGKEFSSRKSETP